MIDEITVLESYMILLLAVVEIGCAVAAIKLIMRRKDAEYQERRAKNRVTRLKEYAEKNRIKHNRESVFAMISGEKELYR